MDNYADLNDTRNECNLKSFDSRPKKVTLRKICGNLIFKFCPRITACSVNAAVDSLFMLTLCEPPSRKIETFSDIATECTPYLLTYVGTFNVSLQL